MKFRIEAIKKKIRKTSYNEVVEKYGYGTLVVGMPLWFAVLPADPFRAENSLDDFVVRTGIGMEEIARKELIRKQCPFKHIIVVWDTTPEAIKEWNAKRSREYEDVANTTLMNPLPVAMLSILSKLSEKVTEQTETTVESELPSCCLHLERRVEKKKTGKGPYPKYCANDGKNGQKVGKRKPKEGKKEEIEAEDLSRALQGILLHKDKRNCRAGKVGYAEDIAETILEKKSNSAKSHTVIQGKRNASQKRKGLMQQ